MQTDIIGDVIAREGGFVDRPDDRGGPTKYGVTAKTLSQWRRRESPKADVENLTEQEARQILTELFLIRPGFDKIADLQVRALAADWGVNSGPAHPVKALQTAVGVTADGAMGPQSLSAVNRADPAITFKRLLAARMTFIGRLIGKDPSQAAFAEGWMTRLAGFLA